MVVGNVYGFGVILHIAADAMDAADDPVYLNKALGEFAKVLGVTRIVTLALRITEVQR